MTIVFPVLVFPMVQKKLPEAISVMERYADELVTTEINVFEIMYGVYLKDFNKEKELSKEFFKNLNILSFDDSCGEISAQILSSLVKKGLMIDQNDCFIASIMIKNGCDRIITRNKKHFSKIKGISVISY